MKDRKQTGDDTGMRPQQQTGEEFGTVKDAQRRGNNIPERSDTPRGSEPETRAASGRRG